MAKQLSFAAPLLLSCSFFGPMPAAALRPANGAAGPEDPLGQEDPVAESVDASLGNHDAMVGSNRCGRTITEMGMSTLLQMNDTRSEYVDFACDMREYQRFGETFDIQGMLSLNCKDRAQLDKGLLVDHFGNKKACPSRNVVWLYPAEDHNSAFCIEGNACHRLLNWVDHACSVNVYRVDSIAQAQRVLSEYPDNSIKHLVLGGHGNGWAIAWGPKGKCSDDALCVDDDVSADFMRDAVKPKMHTHGTIFTDSCLSAHGDPSKNKRALTWWVSRTVRKGVRVFGSDVSFRKVRVTRFDGFHVKIHTNATKDAERLDAGTTTKCPTWANEGSLSDNQECQCPGGTLCRTDSNKQCPSAMGQSSSQVFLPFCAEDWADPQCQCHDGCVNELADDQSCCKAVPFSRKRRGLGVKAFFTRESGDCKCEGEARLIHANGQQCAHAGKRTFSATGGNLAGCECAVAEGASLSS